MTKILSAIIFSLVILSSQAFLTAQELNTSRFEDNSEKSYITEQSNFHNVGYTKVNEARDLNDDRKDSFTKKVVNSGHYTSKTATKTWIPIFRSSKKPY